MTQNLTERAIFVEHLNKTYNDFKAVNDLSFAVHKNECFGLLGPNGAGKTTSMKILYGKTPADKDPRTKIDVFGFDPATHSLHIKALSGIVPQQDNLDQELNVENNLMIYSKFYGMESESATQKILELLSFMELSEKRKANVRELSGGMQRRLTIARALLNSPKLLILDEPTTGLDPQVRHLIWNKLRELKDSGVTMLLTTHYMEEAFQICDRIIIMDKSKKMLEGKPRELLTENVEQHVMEVYGACKDNEACKIYLNQHHIRFESHNETLFAFSNDVDQLKKFAEKFQTGEYHIRSSNLEDLFLKVTGRSLNELQ